MMGFFNGSKKWTRKGKAMLLMLLSAAVLASGCGGGGAKKAAGTSGGGKTTLTIGFTNAPKSFNPLSQPDAAGKFMMRMMYDSLLGQPEVNKFTNHLATSFETKDNQTYTVKLNPKAKWTDGKPVTADDVVFTLNLIANPKVETTWGRYMKMLEGVNGSGKLTSGTAIPNLKKIDATTVQFKTKMPLDANYVKDMIGFNILIFPKHVFEKIDPAKIAMSEEGKKPTVFSGAYKLVKYVTNDHVELAANDGYALGAPKLKKLFLKIQNGTNLVVDLKAGKVQMIAGNGVGVVPIKDMEILKKEKNLEVKNYPSFATQFMMVNNENPELNVKFRNALVHAINRKQIVDQLYKGYAYVNPTTYTKASPAFDKDLAVQKYDPELAKKELKESGYDVNKELTLMVPIGNVQREQSADLIQQNLKAIGLKVKIQKMDFPTLMTHNKNGDFTIMLMGVSSQEDPDYQAYYQYKSLSNFTKANDPKLTGMFEKAAYEKDSAKRIAQYKEIQKYLAETLPNIPLYGEEDFSIQSKNFVGGLKPFWAGSLDDIHMWHFK